MITKIIDYDHLGRGIAKINNKTVFVNNALKGEIVDIEIIKDKKNYSEAIVKNIINKSNNRNNPACKYYKVCGGCDIMHLNYEEQLRFKQEKIKNIITKYLNKTIQINTIIPSDKQYNYRNKITLQVKNNKIGLFKQKTNDLIEIKNCLLVDDEINNILPTLKANNNTKQIIIRKGKNIALSKINNVNEFDTNENVSITLDNITFLVKNNSFFQINNYVTTKLFRHILEICQPIYNKKILDLYCGSGTISLFLAKHCKHITGIEINKEAIICANENKKTNKIDNATFFCQDTSKYPIKEYFDIIIVDPPRSGLNNQIIEQIIKIKPETIIYVSCDPLTLIRDLKILNQHYNIKHITPFDMFPNTHHIETVTLLEKI